MGLNALHLCPSGACGGFAEDLRVICEASFWVKAQTLKLWALNFCRKLKLETSTLDKYLVGICFENFGVNLVSPFSVHYLERCHGKRQSFTRKFYFQVDSGIKHSFEAKITQSPTKRVFPSDERSCEPFSGRLKQTSYSPRHRFREPERSAATDSPLAWNGKTRAFLCTTSSSTACRPPSRIGRLNLHFHHASQLLAPAPARPSASTQSLEMRKVSREKGKMSINESS